MSDEKSQQTAPAQVDEDPATKAPPSLDEGDPETKSDESGTSETD